MKITKLRICNFQSFGPQPREIELDSLTYILGPNGAGKTAVLLALVRLFGVEPTQRRILASDFHVPAGVSTASTPPDLWLEAEFEWPEASNAGRTINPSVPPFFSHMRLTSEHDDIPRARIRLTATMEPDGYVEEKIVSVIELDDDGEPKRSVELSRHDRSTIQVHYLPALRDPSNHISYAAASLLGRALRSANWTSERDSVATLTETISKTIAGNSAISDVGDGLKTAWTGLHKGTYYTNPLVSFGQSELDSLLRLMSVTFTPAPAGQPLDYTRLSDGQKSLLYISLVLALQSIGRDVLAGTSTAFDRDKLRPAVFTVIAVEEPENSLAPQYLGRIVKALREASANSDAQSLIATHSTALMRRVPPEHVRFLRLNAERETTIRTIVMPAKSDDAHKYVREAVLAFPELYFARLVILGEGDSESIVLPRFLAAAGVAEDDASVVVTPLGGRHVNHFWRLLHSLDIPHVTLLDLDFARHNGGWGRIKYAASKLLEFSTKLEQTKKITTANVERLPHWETATMPPDKPGSWRARLEEHGVFFSEPVDLDIMMMMHYPTAYGIPDPTALPLPDNATRKAVLGKGRKNEESLGEPVLRLFDKYHELFDLGSKPASHIDALATMEDSDLHKDMPLVIRRMIENIEDQLTRIPE